MKATSFRPARRGVSGRSGERGIVLVVALIVLVVMALVGLAMMRQATSGVTIAGNVALRQNATEAGDFGTEAAMAWLATQSSAFLSTDHPTLGYYATWGGNIDGDPTKLVYTPGATAVEATPGDATNNRVLYVVHRLCAFVGAPDAIGQQCSSQSDPGSESHGGGAGNYPGGIAAPTTPFYRVSARVEGPKNTLSYIQVLAQ